jgi:DnaJ-class molecular chaperone
MENYYQILGVTTSATAHELRRAYRILARRYHPDVNPGKASEEKFKLIAEAYSVLSDKERRRQYDEQFERFVKSSVKEGFKAYQRQQQRRKKEEEYLRQAQQAADANRRRSETPRTPPVREAPPSKAEGKNREFLISRLAKTLGRVTGLRKKEETDNKDTPLSKVSIIEVSLTIRDAILGIKKTIEISEPAGPRKVSVRIPPGVRTGSVVRLRGRSATNEELVLIIRVASHPFMSMQPRGIVVEVPITVNEAVSGASIVLPTLDEPAIVKVPAGTQSGHEIRLKGKGAQQRDGTKGDIFVRLMIKVPEAPEAAGLKDRAVGLEEYYGSPVRSGMPKTLLD